MTGNGIVFRQCKMKIKFPGFCLFLLFVCVCFEGFLFVRFLSIYKRQEPPECIFRRYRKGVFLGEKSKTASQLAFGT